MHGTLSVLRAQMIFHSILPEAGRRVKGVRRWGLLPSILTEYNAGDFAGVLIRAENYAKIQTMISQNLRVFFADSAFFYPEGEVIGDEFPMNLRCNGGMQPAPYMDEWASYIIEDFNKIAKELKLADGKFHAELLVNADTHEAQIFDVHRRMSGFGEPMPEWDYTTSLMWEDWIVMAECGMDLSDFPRGVKQDRYYHTRSVYAPRNGKLKRVVFDDYLSARMVPQNKNEFLYAGDDCFHTNVLRRQKNFTLENVEITDHIHQPLIGVKLRFNTVKEAEFMSDFREDHFYQHVTFEYED